MSEQTAKFSTDAEATRAIKAALHKAFPDSKFSVTRGGSSIEWTDDGPDIEQVKSALIAADVVTTWKDLRDHLVLQVPGNNSICLDRYNVAERAAYQQDLARRIEENEQRRQRQDEVISAAKQAKCATLKAPPSDWMKQVENGSEVFQAFEQLRQRAENDVATDDDAERQRRPSWGAPLIIEGELLDICLELELLTPDDKPIVKLWAQYADPKKRGTALREQRSNLPLIGITCRGFELHAGSERGKTSDMLFEAQRDKMDEWRFGPCTYIHDYHSPRAHQWEQLVRERDNCQHHYPNSPDKIEACVAAKSALIAEIDAKDQVAAAAFYRHQQLRVRAVELARDRVLAFAGAPGAQMRLAARLSGQCFNCGRALTDPLSLERGIGPECIVHKVRFIRDSADRGKSVATIAFWSGMPEDYVIAVLAEPRPGLKPAPRTGFTSTHITGGYAYLEIGGKFAVLNPEHTGFLCTHDTETELFAWIDDRRREKYAAKQAPRSTP